MIALDELVLPVAGDPRDAQDLACANAQVDAAHDLRTAVILDGQATHVEGDVGRVGLASIDRQVHLAADHQLGQVVLVGLARQALPDDAPPPDDRDPVGDLEDLVELVADEDDAVTIIR